MTDGATPSGASGLVRALLTHSALTGDTAHTGRSSTGSSAGCCRCSASSPDRPGTGSTAAEEALTGPVQVAVVGTEPATLLRVARAAAPAGTVFAVGDGMDDRGIELLRDRTAAGSSARAFVCRGFVCALPTSDAGELAAQLRS